MIRLHNSRIYQLLLHISTFFLFFFSSGECHSFGFRRKGYFSKSKDWIRKNSCVSYFNNRMLHVLCNLREVKEEGCVSRCQSSNYSTQTALNKVYHCKITKNLIITCRYAIPLIQRILQDKQVHWLVLVIAYESRQHVVQNTFHNLQSL